MFTHFFIDRPIFSTVISLFIVLLGLVSLSKLPVSQYPDITPPTITIMATYPGANAEDVINSVVIPIEQAVNGVDNMIYMSSTATSDGSMTITVTFDVGMDPDIATVLVQNRVKTVEPTLPEEVRRQGVNVAKQSPDIIMFMGIVSGKNTIVEEADPTLWEKLVAKMFHMVGLGGHHEKTHEEIAKENADKKNIEAAKKLSDTILKEHKDEDIPAAERDVVYLTNYTKLFVRDSLARINGVGDVKIFSNEDFSMRIWYKPNIMAARGISVQEVNSMIREQNIQIAAGRVGVPPVPKGQMTDMSIVTLGRLSDVSQFENMILRTDDNGGLLYLKDVATIELGPVGYSLKASIDGKPSTVFAIMQRPGANSLAVASAVLKDMERMRPLLRHNGLDFVNCYDATKFTEDSVHEVVITLFEAIFFVSLTVFIFLQDWRASLIPILTIPVSLIGTFFLMEIFGFNINTMTLFGLILAIGIVVDDSIVVVENTQRIIDEEHCDPVTAAKKSMIQVASPVIATALVLIAVFTPTAMITGITGTLYRQFALTIAGSVGISGLCALTLSPALCAILLRPSVPNEKKFFIFRWFNWGFDGFAAGYNFLLKRMTHFGLVVLVFWFGFLALVYIGFKITPTGFLPDEDQGVLFADIRLPEGSSQERTSEEIDKVSKVLEHHRDLIHAVVVINGYSMMDGATAANRAFCVMTLKSWSQRTHPNQKASFLARQIMQELQGIKDSDATCMVFAPPPIRGVGTTGLEVILQDMRDFGPQALAETAREVCGAAMQTPMMFVYAATSFDPSSPRVFLDINWEKARLLQLSNAEVRDALQSYISSNYINDFNAFGRVFRVQVQSDGSFRSDIDNILEMKVKNSLGEMVPLKSFCAVSDTVGPQVLTRYNLYPSATIRAMQYPFRSSGEAIASLEKSIGNLPEGWGYELTGMAYQEKKVGSQAILVFGLSLAFAFLFMSALYESWSSPFIILMAVPLGVMGALMAVMLRQMDINVYTQIGLIVMVGLSAKNAILIVEFAIERRHEGMPIIEAANTAGRLRLRPIMMTSIAFCLGVIPLATATGAGAAGRQAIGTAVCGGLANETLIGIFVTPVLFVLMTQWSEWFTKIMQRFLKQR